MFKDEEICGKLIKLNGQPVPVITWYNPPKKMLNRELLKAITSKYKNYLIMGDLNAHFQPFSKNQNPNGEIFADFIENTTSAHILNNSNDYTSYWYDGGNEAHSIIDLFIGSDLFVQNLTRYEVRLHSKLDSYQNKHYHIPVTASFCLHKKEKLLKKSKNDAYNYDKANWKQFKNCLNEKVEELEAIDDPETLSMRTTDVIKDSMEKSIPKVKKNDRISYANHEYNENPYNFTLE